MPFGFLKKDKEIDAPQAVQVGAYGKIPKMGDFVRVGAKPLPAFETWLEGAIAWGEKRHADAWPKIWGSGKIRAFVYRAPAGVI